jgi:hypothetical protein
MWSRKIRRRIPKLCVGVAWCLCFAVFGWGLQYKMSLYNLPGRHSTSVSTAKLLSQKERPASSLDLESALSPAMSPQVLRSYTAVLFAAVLLDLVLLIYLRVQAVMADGEACQRRLAGSVFFFFRPPPILVAQRAVPFKLS